MTIDMKLIFVQLVIVCFLFACKSENTVEITDLETAKKVMALYDALEDLDDSQNVYSNFDIPDEILEQLD